MATIYLPESTIRLLPFNRAWRKRVPKRYHNVFAVEFTDFQLQVIERHSEPGECLEAAIHRLAKRHS